MVDPISRIRNRQWPRLLSSVPTPVLSHRFSLFGEALQLPVISCCLVVHVDGWNHITCFSIWDSLQNRAPKFDGLQVPSFFAYGHF